jgi:uncharacterized protein
MTNTEIIGLALSAVGGGAINAVAGGGTLLTFPTLLFFGTPAVVANATSTLALVVGTAGSMFGYRRHLKPVVFWLRYFLPVSLLGGLIGSVLLTRTSNQSFSKLVPFLIFFATVLFLLQSVFRKFAGRRMESGAAATGGKLWLAVAFQFLVAVYGGYFGAGIGILMLATLGFIGLHNIHEMNVLKTTLGSMINLVAAVWFAAAGLIDWPRMLVMSAGALAGYYLGSHFSQRIPQAAVRRIILLIGLLLTALTFWQQFVK